jgi:hypothetical protein
LPVDPGRFDLLRDASSFIAPPELISHDFAAERFLGAAYGAG